MIGAGDFSAVPKEIWKIHSEVGREGEGEKSGRPALTCLEQSFLAFMFHILGFT